MGAQNDPSLFPASNMVAVAEQIMIAAKTSARYETQHAQATLLYGEFEGQKGRWTESWKH